MTTYICKCGKEISKSSAAASTGNRLENYEPGHACYGCPYVIPIREYLDGETKIAAYECRMSKTIDYTTFADLKLGTNFCGKIRSLDLSFLKEVRAFADTLEGIEKDRYAFMGRAAEYGADGRFTLTITPTPNKKGTEAKRRIFESFFDVDGHRIDIAPQAEEDHILSLIQESILAEKLAMADIHEAAVPEADEPSLDTDFEVFLPANEVIPESAAVTEEQITGAADQNPVQISGRRVSILNREFEEIVCKIDEMLNRALSIAVDARQGFSVTAKISLMPRGTRFAVSHNVGYKFDPLKVEDKGALYEEIAIAMDEAGHPIIPDGSAAQLTFDEVTAGATVTTDADGVVQSVELDDENFGRIFPCACTDCPLYTGFTGGETGCSFGENANAVLDDDLKGYIYDAVTVHRCERAVINAICEKEFPPEPVEGEPDPYPCMEIDCWMNDEASEPHCRLSQDGQSEPVGTEDGDYIDAVEVFNCTRRCVLARLQKIRKGEEE